MGPTEEGATGERGDWTADVAHDGAFRLAFDGAATGMALVSTEPFSMWRFIHVNAALARITGRPADDLLTCDLFSFTHHDDVEDLRDALGSLLSRTAAGREVEVRWTHSTGLDVPVALTLSIVRDRDGRPAVGVVQVQDVGRRRRAEEATRAAIWRFRSIVETAPDAFIGMDDAGFVVDWNHQAETAFGWKRDEVMGRPFVDTVIPAADRLAREAWLRAFMETGEAAQQYVRVEMPVVHRDGHEFPVELTAWPIRSGDASMLLVFAHDITERRAFENRLVHQAMHDPLTGLPNRTLFVDRLQQAITRQARHRSKLAVLFLDIDRFKVLNDSLGHDVGDQLLVAVAQRIESVMRRSDTLARFGGDEFTLLCEDADEEVAVLLAGRIGDALAAPFGFEGGEGMVTVSAGVALATTGEERPETLLRDADAALSRAKERGRACVEVFNGVIRARAVERLETERALRRALDRKELRLAYQPLVSLTDGRIMGAEALVRWKHPDKGWVAPAEFVPIAEDTGLIVPIGRWVLHEACRQGAAWQEHPFGGEMKMAVNLSARQLARPDFVDVVMGALDASGIEPARLCVEITESVVMDESESLAGGLRAIRDLGVQVAIDDFGTAYSSLSYLTRFPVDVLKVDRSFVKGLGHDTHSSAIVAAVIGLAHALDLEATAEGVETAEQLHHLRELACDSAQGHYFAKPGPSEQIDALLGREFWAPSR